MCRVRTYNAHAYLPATEKKRQWQNCKVTGLLRGAALCRAHPASAFATAQLRRTVRPLRPTSYTPSKPPGSLLVAYLPIPRHIGSHLCMLGKQARSQQLCNCAEALQLSRVPKQASGNMFKAIS